MSIWFVPRDAAARSMGADAVASALEARGETVIRNGSRGSCGWSPWWSALRNATAPEWGGQT